MGRQDGQFKFRLVKALESRQGYGRAGNDVCVLPEQEILSVAGEIRPLETSDGGPDVEWRVVRQALRPDGFEVVGQSTQMKRRSAGSKSFKRQQSASKRQV